jgi:hypothetical protein
MKTKIDSPGSQRCDLEHPMITNRSGDDFRNVHVSKIKVQMTREARRYAKRTVLNHEPCKCVIGIRFTFFERPLARARVRNSILYVHLTFNSRSSDTDK